jgi:conjugal transfer/entry exclusion protein
MRSVFLATCGLIASLSIEDRAQAQGYPVYDNSNFIEAIEAVATAGKELAQMQAQLTQLQQTYQMFTHPSDITGMLPQLNTSFLQNSMPAANQMGNQIAGTTESMSSMAQAFFNQNHVYTATGTDALAGTLNKSATALANIQGIAATNLSSIEQRLSDLGQMQTELQGASDIKQVEAINGRIAIEQNAVSAQEAQATNLQALGSAQISSNEQAQEQQMREGHEKAAQQFTGTLN